jgi:Zn-dependent protease
MNDGNGDPPIPGEVFDSQFPRFPLDVEPPPPFRRRRRRLWPALLLFFLTVISTLAVGSEFARSYARDIAPFSGSDDLFLMILFPLKHPSLLLLGIPFSITVMGILLAHELGHYFASKFYRMDVSYPYFIPAPTLFGTFGAFILIRSPFRSKRALFDVGIAGPIAGFVLAVPAMAFGIAWSKIAPDAQASASILFGNPLLVRIFIALFHPGVDPTSLLLHPVARAAWLGLLATALNLMPIWQLDGGHILYSLESRHHRTISIVLSLVLIVLGRFAWPAWYFWGGALLLLTLRFRHPPVMDRWEPLDERRKLLALVALAIFALCYTLSPTSEPPEGPAIQARFVGSTSMMTAVSGISFEAQKSRQPERACARAERCGDFKTNWKR